MRWTAEAITGFAEQAGYRDAGLQAIVARALYFSEGRDDYTSPVNIENGAVLVGLFAVPEWVAHVLENPGRIIPAKNAVWARDVLGDDPFAISIGVDRGAARWTLATAQAWEAIQSGVRTMTAPDVVGVDNLPPMLRNLRQQFASATNLIYGGIKRFRSNIDH